MAVKAKVNLHGFYGIGEREVQVVAYAERDGVRVVAELPGVVLMTSHILHRLLSWDEAEASEDAVRRAGLELARDVVRLGLPEKKPGETYSDGTD